MTDSELVAAYVQGNDQAMSELVDRYQLKLCNFIYRLIGDIDKAEDLVQETFLRVHRHAEHFRQKEKFSSWIYAIAGNLAKNELRDRSRTRLIFMNTLEGDRDEDRPIEFEDDRYGPDRLCEQRRVRALVHRTIGQLNVVHQQVFRLREIEGRTYEDIAVILRCNLGTVKSRLCRARRAFAAHIEPYVVA